MRKEYRNVLCLILAILSITVGGLIYVSFRPEPMLMYKWIDTLNLNPFVYRLRELTSNLNSSSFVKYNLPNGLWATAYTLIMVSVWTSVQKGNVVWFILIPLIAVISEFMQLLTFVHGRFDWIDILCYIIPTLILLTTKQTTLCIKKTYYPL